MTDSKTTILPLSEKIARLFYEKNVRFALSEPPTWEVMLENQRDWYRRCANEVLALVAEQSERPTLKGCVENGVHHHTEACYADRRKATVQSNDDHSHCETLRELLKIIIQRGDFYSPGHSDEKCVRAVQRAKELLG